MGEGQPVKGGACAVSRGSACDQAPSQGCGDDRPEAMVVDAKAPGGSTEGKQ